MRRLVRVLGIALLSSVSLGVLFLAGQSGVLALARSHAYHGQRSGGLPHDTRGRDHPSEPSDDPLGRLPRSKCSCSRVRQPFASLLGHARVRVGLPPWRCGKHSLVWRHQPGGVWAPIVPPVHGSRGWHGREPSGEHRRSILLARISLLSPRCTRGGAHEVDTLQIEMPSNNAPGEVRAGNRNCGPRR